MSIIVVVEKNYRIEIMEQKLWNETKRIYNKDAKDNNVGYLVVCKELCGLYSSPNSHTQNFSK